jgi:hypothetical protein
MYVDLTTFLKQKVRFISLLSVSAL